MSKEIVKSLLLENTWIQIVMSQRLSGFAIFLLGQA